MEEERDLCCKTVIVFFLVGGKVMERLVYKKEKRQWQEKRVYTCAKMFQYQYRVVKHKVKDEK